MLIVCLQFFVIGLGLTTEVDEEVAVASNKSSPYDSPLSVFLLSHRASIVRIFCCFIYIITLHKSEE